MRISVITVTLNNLEGLMRTEASIVQQSADFEWIVIDGGSRDGTVGFLKHSTKLNPKWISEPDQGIYDAMNKGLDVATGDYVLFLNAGDYFVGDVLGEINENAAPVYIPVKTLFFYKEYFIKPKSYKMGLPYCHQGIIFHNNGLRYDTRFKIAADYDFYLRHGYSKVSLLNTGGLKYIYFDNEGISAQNYRMRDREILNIIGIHFGLYSQAVFWTWASAKRVVKLALCIGFLFNKNFQRVVK